MLELTTLLVNAHFEAEGRRGSERFSSPSAERGRVATEAMEAIAITLTRHARTDHLGTDFTFPQERHDQTMAGEQASAGKQMLRLPANRVCDGVGVGSAGSGRGTRVRVCVPLRPRRRAHENIRRKGCACNTHQDRERAMRDGDGAGVGSTKGGSERLGRQVYGERGSHLPCATRRRERGRLVTART
eukprot:scaffold198413_cov24-Tisochrysis_lutea.AAC.1